MSASLCLRRRQEMNWVSYESKRKDDISKREQEWFSKRESENTGKYNPLEISSANFKNVGLTRNLDMQRISNLTVGRKGKGIGRLTINKINLERTNTRYSLVDMDKNIRRPKRTAYDSFKCVDNDKCATKNYISISSTLKSNEKPKINHRSQRAYNCIETFEVEDRKMIGDNEESCRDDEIDQPFFIKYEDLREVAFLKKRNDSILANKNTTTCTVITDRRNVTVHDGKQVGTKCSHMGGQQCKAWNENSMLNGTTCRSSRCSNCFESPLVIPSKSSKVVTFNDYKTNPGSHRPNGFRRCTMDDPITAFEFLKFDKTRKRSFCMSEVMKLDDDKFEHGDLQSCCSSPCKSETIIEIISQDDKEPQDPPVDFVDFDGSKEDHVNVDSISEFRGNVERIDGEISIQKLNDDNICSGYYGNEIRIPDNGFIFHKCSYTKDIMNLNDEEAISTSNAYNNNNNNNNNYNNNYNSNYNNNNKYNNNNDDDEDDYFGDPKHHLLMNQQHVECQTDVGSLITNPSSDASCQTLSIQKEMVDAFTSTFQNEDSITSRRDCVASNNDDDGDDDDDDTPKVLDLSLKVNNNTAVGNNQIKGQNDQLRVCSSIDCSKTCVGSSCLPIFVRDVLHHCKKVLGSRDLIDKDMEKTLEDEVTAPPLKDSKQIEPPSMSSEQCLDDVVHVIDFTTQESSLYESGEICLTIR